MSNVWFQYRKCRCGMNRIYNNQLRLTTKPVYINNVLATGLDLEELEERQIDGCEIARFEQEDRINIFAGAMAIQVLYRLNQLSMGVVL